MAQFDASSCKIPRATEQFHGKQGLDYSGAISAESSNAKGICMHIVNFPPGAKANAHLHEDHETAIYMLDGEVGMWYGDNLEHHLVAKSGDFVFIPAGIPHLPYNVSDTEPGRAVLARTDPNEQESVMLRPDLDSVHQTTTS